MTPREPPAEQLRLLAASLRRAREHAEMGAVLPPGTRFARLKNLALRSLELVSKPQVTFNHSVLEALERAADVLQDFELREVAAVERSKADEVARSIAEARADAVAGAAAAEHPQPPALLGRARPRAVLLSTFRVGRRFNGGELRSFHLARALAERFDVEFISLGGRGEPASRMALAPGLVETVVPRSLAQHAVELAYRRDLALEVPVGDVLVPELLRFTPAYLESARLAVEGAALVQLEHPYLLPAVAQLAASVPLVYNAHNAEFLMKQTMLPSTAAGRDLLERVRRVECEAVQRARMVATCSPEDAASLQREFGGGDALWVDTPNGVDLDTLPFTGAEERQRLSADWLRRLHVGGGRMAGTRRSAVFIANGQPPSWEAAEAVIALAPRLPEVCFLLVGTHSFRFRDRALPANVVALGPVPEYGRRLLLAAADVGLNPMTTGSGSNLKLPEYLGAGLPVVATQHGVRGFAVEDGVHLRIADIGQFEVAVRAALEEQGVTERMALAGRALVEERYRWDTIGARLAAAAAEVAGC